jgi:hypothetical protein
LGKSVADGESPGAVLAPGRARFWERHGTGVNGGIREECPAGPLYQPTFGGAAGFSGQCVRGPGRADRFSPADRRGSRPRLHVKPDPRAAYPAATVDQTSLGTEFAAGDLYGVFTDSTASSPLEIMFAGINCIFR